MAGTRSKNDSPKGEDEPKLWFNQSQYDMLKRCSDKKDMAEWNEWRKNNPEEDVLLEGAPLAKFYLRGARLNKHEIRDKNDKTFNPRGNREGWLNEVHMERANLHMADLRGAHLEYANLKGAILDQANLQNADLWQANLEGGDFGRSKLQGAWMNLTTVDNTTILWKPDINKYHKNERYTDFSDMGLSNVRMDPGTKQLIEYNIRRKNWDEWYSDHSFLKYPVSSFWWLSDYGLSTWRVIKAFLILAVIFAAVYANCAYWAQPGIVHDLALDRYDPFWHYVLMNVVRPIYFSVVTMTTLGFGDMYAQSHSVLGHVLLTVQVILGYVLLGALVTRFAVLFTAGGPARKFEELSKKEKKVFENIRVKKKQGE